MNTVELVQQFLVVCCKSMSHKLWILNLDTMRDQIVALEIKPLLLKVESNL